MEHRVYSCQLLNKLLIETVRRLIGLGCGYGDDFSFRTEDINVGWEREVLEAVGHLSLTLGWGLDRKSPSFHYHVSESMQDYSHQWCTA